MSLVREVKSWYLRYPYGLARLMANCRFPIEVNWRGFDLKYAARVSEDEIYDHLSGLYADGDSDE